MNSGRSLVSSCGMTLKLGALLFLTFIPAVQSQTVTAQDSRKIKVSVQPTYPELARRNNIHGTARLELVIAADGSVKDVHILGGSPLLVQAAVDAVKKWKYEPAATETTIIVKFEFKS